VGFALDSARNGNPTIEVNTRISHSAVGAEAGARAKVGIASVAGSRTISATATRATCATACHRSASCIDVKWAQAYPKSKTDWKNTRAVVHTALVPPYVGSSERATSGSTRNASAAARKATAT
jgi:hypothetical protein